MNVQEAVNFRLNKLDFKEIWENQRKVVEAYFNGPDALMITPTGSEKSLTFHIAPIVLDLFKQSERNIVKTVCLVIFAQVSGVVSSRERSQRCCFGSKKFRGGK